tara:strand:+ start:2464 stop:2652 length:189 start_codon:yes stop_codon:yes gene_type:complete
MNIKCHLCRANGPAQNRNGKHFCNPCADDWDAYQDYIAEGYPAAQAAVMTGVTGAEEVTGND